MLAELSSNLSISVYVVGVIAVIGVMLGACVFGERHMERATATPYESGIRVTGNARTRFSSHFYLFAMFFVVFDLESIFLYAWSLDVVELGAMGFMQASVFIIVLLVALAYLWRTKGLDIRGSQL